LIERNEISKKINEIIETQFTEEKEKDKRRQIYLLNIDNKNLINKIIETAERDNNVNELIIYESKKGNYYDAYAVYINFRKKIDLYKTDLINNLNLDKVITKISEKKDFVKRYGKKIYDRKFD